MVATINLGSIMDTDQLYDYTDTNQVTRQNLGLLPKWDSIRITTEGSNEGALSVFQMKENGEVVFDLVAVKGCESVWFEDTPFKEDGWGGGCYTETVFEQETFPRTILLDSAGNFNFESCKCEWGISFLNTLMVACVHFYSVFDFFALVKFQK